MGTISREQLIKYVKGLEQKVKDYQSKVKDQDNEISKLRQRLVDVTGDNDVINKVLYSMEQQAELDEPSKPAIQSAPPENKSAPAKTPIPPTVSPRLVAKPLEEKSPTFVKKPAVGVDAAIKRSQENQKKAAEPAVIESHSTEAVPSTAEEFIEDITVAASEPAKEETAVPVPLINFKAGEFLSAVLDGEAEADEVKSTLARLATVDPYDQRNVYVSLSRVCWQLFNSMGKRLVKGPLSWEKRLFMRYGMLDDKLMTDRMEVWNQLYADKGRPGETGIYYLDEWLEEIANGTIKFSTIDEMALDGAKPDQNATGILALRYELSSVAQMHRMCVGPRANPVTVLTQEYCMPSIENPVVNRQWVIASFKEVLSCDYKMFYRKHKGEEKIVKPLFIICPGYGQRSGCWEPWSPGKKGDTGPRICICAFPPRNSMRTLVEGVADYRWEFAKADAMHYWMTEGMTGKWISLFSRREQQKDLKVDYVNAYYHWVMNEARLIPRLDKKFRDFFWQNMPYSDEIKERVKKTMVFSQLIEQEEAKKRREEEEAKELERIKAEREARKAARLNQGQK